MHGEEESIIGQIVNKILEESFLKLRKDMCTQTQEVYSTTNRQDQKGKSSQKRNSHWRLIAKTLNTQQRKSIDTCKRKTQVTYKRQFFRTRDDFSMETLNAKISWRNAFLVLKKHSV